MIKPDEIKKNSDQLLKKLSESGIAELEELVRFHNKKYFVDNAPVITDEAFDKLVEALRFLKPESKALIEMGEGKGHGKSGQLGAEVHHLTPMLSLDKCYDEDTFLHWAEKIKGSLISMPKIDGVACSLRYEPSGKLILGATRGDGKNGENVTQNIVPILDIPKHIPLKKAHSPNEADVVDIRGEVFLNKKRFEKYFAKEFVSPRNLAAGALKHKDQAKSAQYGLSFMPYDVRGLNLATEAEKFQFLEQMGFRAMPWRLLKDEQEANEVFKEFYNKRLESEYELDGVVYRANQISEQTRLGETAHHPRYAIAYKFQTEQVQTELIDVEWSVGRTGVITPVAIVRPVFVSGATINRATLHNLGLMQKKGISIPCLVEIVRRGGVIPHVEQVLRKNGPLVKPPKKCPSCGHDTIVDGDILRCSNALACKEVLIGRLLHFCHVIDLAGFGEKLIRALVEAKKVKKLVDLFYLTKEDLLQLERMGDILATKLINQLAQKKRLSFAQFLTALGFDEVGPTIAQTLEDSFPTLDSLKKASLSELMACEGIGESIAHSVLHNLKLFEKEIDEILPMVEIIAKSADAKIDTSHPLYGKKVVFTGKMVHMDRKTAQGMVQKLGGKTPSQMSSEVDYLVVGDEGSPLLGPGKKSTKQTEAEKLKKSGHDVKIISETDFMKVMK